MSKWENRYLTVELPGSSEKGDAFVAGFRDRTKSGKVGFYDWPVQIPKTELAQILEVAQGIRQRCKGALIFGIGGSFLGGAALEQALSVGGRSEFPLYWVGNSDPGVIEGAAAFLKQHGRVAAIVISKSGNTTETMAGFFHFAKQFQAEDIVTVTDPEKGELRRLTREQGWKSFALSPNIGGRFSVLTAVGLLPAALMGLSPEKILEGAKSVRDELERTGMTAALDYARAVHGWDQNDHRNVHVLMGYRDGLKRTTEWFVQLWGESIGKQKNGKGVGPTPLSALGTSDQHSLLQLFKEGPQDKVVGFLEVKARAGEATVAAPPFDPGSLSIAVGKTFTLLTNEASRAVEKSLNKSGTPTYRISLPALDEATLGAFFFFQMTACALAGEVYGIDAFDQPGVEEAKVLLKEALVKG